MAVPLLVPLVGNQNARAVIGILVQYKGVIRRLEGYPHCVAG